MHLLGVRKQGDYELQVSVAGKAFDRLKSVPFSVRNPMVIEMHPRPNGLVMWTEVIAPGLYHRGLRVTAKVKRPPAPSKLVSVQRMPGGLWKLGVDAPKGLVEIKFDIAGNYLNGRDYSIRTEPIRVTLPIAGPKFVHLDGRGRPILADQPGFRGERAGNGALADSGSGIQPVAGNPTPPAAFALSGVSGISAAEVSGALIPGGLPAFWVVVTCCSASLFGGCSGPKKHKSTLPMALPGCEIWLASSLSLKTQCSRKPHPPDPPVSQVKAGRCLISRISLL